MKILAIETATDACSAAVLCGNDLHERQLAEPRAHSRLILDLMQQVLVEAGLRLAELDALAFGRGPGSFTGVRIAAGVVQGAAFAVDLPVVPISTLAALAQGVAGGERVLAALDARMGEVYWGAFARGEDDIVAAVGAERVCVPAATPRQDGSAWDAVGPGWGAYGDVLQARHGAGLRRVLPDRLPRARDVAVLAALGFTCGRAVPAASALPVYLRDSVVRTDVDKGGKSR